MSKTGLVVEGGGMKCAYSAGVLDAFLDDQVTFDYCIGVSAGAANVASYLARQRERNLRFYTIHVKDPRYISIRNLFHTGSVFGLQYIYGTLTNSDGKDPLDYDAVMSNPAEFCFPATDAISGEVTYFNKKDLIRDDYRSIMATCAMPAFCKPVEFKGHLYYDGGVGDSIPVRRALHDGCNKLVIILEVPRDFEKQPERHRRIYKKMLRKYPNTIHAVDKRHLDYRTSMRMAFELERQGKAIVLAPSEHVKIGTFTTDPQVEQQLYELGMKDYKANKEKIAALLS